MWFRMCYCLDTVYQEVVVSRLIHQGYKPGKRSSGRYSSLPHVLKANGLFHQPSLPGPWEWGSLTGREDLDVGLQGWLLLSRVPTGEAAGLMQEGYFS